MLNPKMQMRKKMLDAEAKQGPSLQFKKRGEQPGAAPKPGDDGEEVGQEFVQMMVTPEEKEMILQSRQEKTGEPQEEMAAESDTEMG